MSGIHWRNYQRSLPRQADGQRAAPRAGEIVPHLEEGIAVFKEQTVVSYVSLFETFAQTWALNMLLARLECGLGWTHAERNLSRAFSPEHSDDLPSLPRILQAFPALGVGLKGLPAYVAPDQGEEVPVAVTETFNALSAVRAWRAFRNSLVHRGGILNSRFLARHGSYLSALRLNYPYMPDLRVGGRILMYDALVRSIAAEHNRAALWMSDELEAVSGGRRGHPFSPNAKPAKVFFRGDPPPDPPLLMAGDHEGSYGWESSAEFRTRFREMPPA
jgi:hypothetical protein